jgi:hypothetical protein
MTEPPAAMPPRMPVARPASPAAVNIATALLVAVALVWLVVFAMDGGAARAEDPTAPTSPLFLLDLIYIILILLAWAGRDTRGGMIVMLALFALLFVGVPFWIVVQPDADVTPGGEALVMVSLGLFAMSVIGVRMLYGPAANAFFVQSKGYRMAVKEIRRRRR